MANEKELVLRGKLARPFTGLEGTDFIQFERHLHLPEGMITNRCRVESYRNERIYTTATKYTFSKEGNTKTAYEVQQSIDPETFEVIANLCNEQIIKTRYELRRPEFVLELDIFRDMVNGGLSDGFKIDIEGDYEPTQEEIEALLAEYNVEVEEWLDPAAWGERYNAITRIYKDKPPVAAGTEDNSDTTGNHDLPPDATPPTDQPGLEGQDSAVLDEGLEALEALDLIAPLHSQHLGDPDQSEPAVGVEGVEDNGEATPGLESIEPTDEDVRTPAGRILRGNEVYSAEGLHIGHVESPAEVEGEAVASLEALADELPVPASTPAAEDEHDNKE